MNISTWINSFEKDMRVLGDANNTQFNYLSQIRQFLGYFEKLGLTSPERINAESVKEYLLLKIKPNTQRHAHSAIKHFYKLTIHQEFKFKYIPYTKKEKSYPIILSKEETQKLFNACDNVKHKTIMYVAYATGVRVSELLGIRLCDIDRPNMVIHIMHGKGAKQRQVTMKSELLKIIEDYWRIYRTKEYLFEGQLGGQYTASSINQFLKHYAQKAGIKKKVHIHLLRHLYATHSLEAGENLYVTQKCLGHSNPATTANIYYHISPHLIANAYSPILNVLP